MFTKSNLAIALFCAFISINLFAQDSEINQVEVKSKGTIKYNATSLEYNLSFGTYTYSWLFDDNSYKVDASVVATGLLKTFVNYSLKDRSRGFIENGDLKWNSYRYSKIYDDKKRPPRTRASKRINGNQIKFSDESIDKIEKPVFDVSALILHLMRQNQDIGKIISIDVVTHRKRLPLDIKLEKLEKVEVDAGNFDAYVWYGKTPKVDMKVWLDSKTLNPVKFYFTVDKAGGFLLESKKIN